MSSTPAVPQSPPRKKQELVLRECILKVIPEVGRSDFSMASVDCKKVEVNHFIIGIVNLQCYTQIP